MSKLEFLDSCGTIEAWDKNPEDQCDDQEPLAYISVGGEIMETSLSFPQQVSIAEVQEILSAAKIVDKYRKTKTEAYKGLLKELNKETK
jgi:hypothetical protein